MHLAYINILKVAKNTGAYITIFSHYDKVNVIHKGTISHITNIIMENLADLPASSSQKKTLQEEQMMDQFFPQNNKEVEHEPTFTEKMHLKKVGIATILFVILSNPIADKIYTQIPYVNEGLSVFVFKTILFFFMLMLINYFM